MASPQYEYEDVIGELKRFYQDLKQYKEILEKDKSAEELREKLIYRSGKLKPLIIELTKKQYTGRAGMVWDMWDMGLDPYPSLPDNKISLSRCVDATNEAIGKLESDIKRGIRDKQGNVIAKPPVDKAGLPIYLFDKMQLHPKVIAVSKSLFETGHYAQAIFEAFKAVNNFVKEKTGSSLDGKDLMSKVFNEDTPVIKLNELLNQSDRDEQEGFRFLFMGAMVGIRNPKAHDNIVQADPYRTLEYLSFASLLMKRIEEGKVVRLQKHG